MCNRPIENCKAPGADDMIGEMLEYFRKVASKLAIFRVPDDWTKAFIVPDSEEKVSKFVCKNISIIPGIVYARIFIDRVQEETVKEV